MEEPARSRALELTLVGHLLASRLRRKGVCSAESDFASVWRDRVVPIAVRDTTEWQVGMCAVVTAELETADSHEPLEPEGIVGRIMARAPDGAGWVLLIHGPGGLGGVVVDAADLKATTRPAAILSLWRPEFFIESAVVVNNNTNGHRVFLFMASASQCRRLWLVC